MNFRFYLTQTREQMKQRPLFTAIYVAGTGLSIALVMTLFIIFYVKFAPVYPEYNRNRMLVISSMSAVPKEDPNSNLWCTDGTKYKVVTLLEGLPHMDAVTGVYHGDEAFVEHPLRTEQLSVYPCYTDASFWQVFTFRFLQGKPFTAAAVESRLKEAVVSERLAKQLFGDADATGQTIHMDGTGYRICGVVADASAATPASADDLWLPVSLSDLYAEELTIGYGLMGDFQLYMTAPTPSECKELKAEIEDVFHRYNQEASTPISYRLNGQPDRYWESTFRENACSAPDLTNILMNGLWMLLALLLIPAMNLSGMVASGMDERISEIGIRKTYGATNRQLLTQVLNENLLLTCLGGVLGLLLSYLIVLTASSWIMTLFNSFVMTRSTTHFTFEMLFNPWVLLAAFLVCIVLNLISAIIPTWWALRRPIIQSVNMKD
jgi:hypothetical protein